MSAVLTNPPAAPRQESPGLWALAWRRMCQDTVGMVALAVVLFFLLLMAAAEKAGFEFSNTGEARELVLRPSGS